MFVKKINLRVKNNNDPSGKSIAWRKSLEIPRIKEIRNWRVDFRENPSSFSLFFFLREKNTECRTYLHQDAFEILTHRHAAQFDAKVPELETRPFRLDLRLLFTGVDVRHF